MMHSAIRSSTLSLAIMTLAVSCLHADDRQRENRYNVLFICVDDLRPELGCYGAEWAQTPCLDSLARSSLIFDRHYVQVPTCGASRFALLTGRSPWHSGVTGGNNAFYGGNTAFSQTQLVAAQSMPELFRRSGYTTSCIGKVSHTADGLVYAYDGTGDGRHEVPHAWDIMRTPLGEWGRGWGIFFAYADGKHREDGQGHRQLTEFTVERDQDLPDGLIADEAISQLEQFSNSDSPFFLAVGFFKPHLPFVAPAGDWEAFETTDIPLPDNPEIPESEYWHQSGEFNRYETEWEKSRPLAPASSLASRRGYLACVRYADRQIGRVLDALEQLDLADNTIVVVWGDHGWHLGERAIWGKHSPFERANRSVLMMRVPEMETAGQVSSALVETVDLYPTLIDLCEPSFRETEYPLDGRSLVPILNGDSETVRDVAVSYWRNAVSIRGESQRWIAKVDRSQDGMAPVLSDLEIYQIDNQGESTRDLTEILPPSELELIVAQFQDRLAILDEQAAQEDHEERTDLFDLSNLVAWCVVPFDASSRSPSERAQMLGRLGISKLAYDWREQHVDLFEEEIQELKKHDIEYFAFWDAHPEMLRLCREHDIHPQFWKMIPDPGGETHDDRVAAAGRALLPLLDQLTEIDCQLGLYNHGGWAGEPENMIDVCQWLREARDTDRVGIVYNLHHGHDRLQDFRETLDQMTPYLLCLNLNGMNSEAQPKILPIGRGEHDVRLIEVILESDYDGPIGVLDHRSELDAEESLRQNLEGLRALLDRR